MCTLTSFIVQYAHNNARNVTVLPRSFHFLIALKSTNVHKRYIERQLLHFLLHEFLSLCDKCVASEACSESRHCKVFVISVRFER